MKDEQRDSTSRRIRETFEEGREMVTSISVDTKKKEKTERRSSKH